jgi:hypothetical protein
MHGNVSRKSTILYFDRPRLNCFVIPQSPYNKQKSKIAHHSTQSVLVLFKASRTRSFVSTLAAEFLLEARFLMYNTFMLHCFMQCRAMHNDSYRAGQCRNKKNARSVQNVERGPNNTKSQTTKSVAWKANKRYMCVFRIIERLRSNRVQVVRRSGCRSCRLRLCWSSLDVGIDSTGSDHFLLDLGSKDRYLTVVGKRW